MTQKMKIWIISSLLLNILLAGMILGHMGHLFHGHFFHHHMAALIKTLPETRQEEFHNVMDKLRDDNHVIFQQIEQVRNHTIEILKADNFDATAYQQQVEKMRDLRRQQQEHFADAIKKLAKRWSPEERALLAEMLHHPMYGVGDSPKDGGKPPAP